MLFLILPLLFIERELGSELYIWIFVHVLCLKSVHIKIHKTEKEIFVLIYIFKTSLKWEI